MTTIEYGRLYIDGRWAAPASAERIRVTEAATEEHLGSVPAATERDIDAAVGAARKAFDDPEGWATWSPARRGDVLERFAAALEARGAETARRVSVQNGMPLWLAQNFEAGFPALLLRYYAGLVAAGQEEVRAGMLGKKSLIRREPIGVVAAIVPWNVPQAISFLKLGPALAAGNTVVLKPAPETVLDAFLMAEAALEAGLPPGVLNVVPAGREVGAYLVAHPGVDKVSFTGSTAAGRAIAETCGRLLRPVTLELGGKSAAIILDDADLTASLEPFFGTTLLNNGADLLAVYPRPGPAEPVRHRRRDHHGPRAVADDRRPARPGHQDRPAGLGAAAGPRRVVHRQGQGRRRPHHDRGQAPGGIRPGMVRRADDLRRRRPEGDDRAGGDLRAGARRDPVRRRARGRRDRQRQRIRAGRIGVDR